MEDTAAFLTGVCGTLILGATFSFGYMVHGADISWECRKIGVFYVGDQVFTCEKKELK